MVNYNNGKIYKIINENNEIIYIGSTCEIYLSKRYAKHNYKSPNNKIILIENYSCNSKEELRKREQEVIEEYTNLLNKNRAYITEEQKIKNKIEYDKTRKDYKKEHYNKNKKDINNKKLLKINCDICGCITSRNHLTRHKKTLKCKNYNKI